MAERQIPGGPYLVEDATRQAQIPGGPYVNVEVTSSGSQSLTATAYTNTSTFGTPTVGRGAVTLTPTKATNTSTFGTPVVGRGAVTLTATTFANINAFYTPSVEAPGALSPTLFENQNTFYGPVVSGGGRQQQVGGRARKYRRRYIVEVDGQDFAVESEEDARALLESAKETAQEVVEQAIVSAKAAPPTLKAPRIRVRGEVGPELQSLIAEVALVRQQIRDLYERARRDAEIAYLMQLDDDEEAISLLL